MNKKIKIFTLMILFVVVGLESCTTDEVYDFQGDKYNRLYFRKTSSEEGIRLFCYQENIYGKVNVKKRIETTRLSESDISIRVVVDNSYVKKYNEKNGTEYIPVPVDLFSIKNEQLLIKKGKMISESFFELSIPDEKFLNISKEKKYLIPIKIDKLSESSQVRVSSNMGITYISLQIIEDQDNIWDNATLTTANLYSDRSDWSLSAAVSLNFLSDNLETDGSKVFDGSNSTLVNAFADEDLPLIVDMGKSISDIIGLSVNELALGTTFYSSLDGENWDFIGVSSSTKADIPFYLPIRARYIKWVVKAEISQFFVMAHARVSEFNIYTR